VGSLFIFKREKKPQFLLLKEKSSLMLGMIKFQKEQMVLEAFIIDLYNIRF